MKIYASNSLEMTHSHIQDLEIAATKIRVSRLQLEDDPAGGRFVEAAQLLRQAEDMVSAADDLLRIEYSQLFDEQMVG